MLSKHEENLGRISGVGIAAMDAAGELGCFFRLEIRNNFAVLSRAWDVKSKNDSISFLHVYPTQELYYPLRSRQQGRFWRFLCDIFGYLDVGQVFKPAELHPPISSFSPRNPHGEL
jgi:hypothetical protein